MPRLRQNPTPHQTVPTRTLHEPEGVRHDGDNGLVMQEGVVPHPGDGEEAPSYQWMHQPEVLIKGCCNYTASVSFIFNYFIL